MLKLKFKKWILLGLMLMMLLSSFYSHAQMPETFGGFTFSTDIPAAKVKMLKEDIQYLYSLPEMKDTDNFQGLTGMKALSGPDFHNWIVNRIHFFIAEATDLDRLFGYTEQSYKYENANLIPDISGGTNRIEQGVVLATNIGGSLYLTGKQSKNLSTFTINGKTRPVLSTRVGVMQIADAYFDKQYQGNRLYRISTLFHEARHSDGHGLNTAFIHEICPAGHAYEGERACDKLDNGSYGLEARFDRLLSKNCKDCKVADIESLRMMSLDNYSRLILPPAGTAKVVKLQNAMATYQHIINLCRTITKKDDDCSAETMKATSQKFVDARAQLANLVHNDTDLKSARPVVDAKPEGYYLELDLTQSRTLMGNPLQN